MSLLRNTSLYALLLFSISSFATQEDNLYQIQCDVNDMVASHCQVDSQTTQGWHTFQTFCKKCHAEDAIGSEEAPDLVKSLATMSKEDFLTNLLKKNPKQHQWEGKVQVNENKEQLWIYLRARADKILPAGRLRIPEEMVKPYTVVCRDKGGKATRNPCQVDKATFEGWRAFHGFCQGCHARDAQGNTVAPHLLDSLKVMSKQSFSKKLLNDYQVYHPWIENHVVTKHIDELWAYLKARSDGVLPINRPSKINR